MALKKVRRPVTEPSKDRIPFYKRLEQGLPEGEANTNEGKEPFMNPFNTVSSEETNEIAGSNSNASFQQSPVMDKIISFQDGSVSMQRLAKVEEGVYGFSIDEITVRENVRTQYGMKDQYVITFSFYSGTSEQFVKLSKPYNISSNQQSALMIFLGAFREVFKGQRITIRHLIGMTGRARVHHVVSEAGNVFEKIEVIDVEGQNAQ